MILYGQDQWVIRAVKSIVFDSVFHDIFEQDFGCQSPSVVNDRFTFFTVPTVQFYATATLFKNSNVGVDAALTSDLITQQISVVRRCNPIV